MSMPVHYTGLTVDRAIGRRSDPSWVAEMRALPEMQVIPMWRDQCLVRSGRPVTLTLAHADRIGEKPAELVFLGLAGDAPLFALDLSALEQSAVLRMTGAAEVADVRALINALSHDEASLLAYARGILHWQRRQQYCGYCGSRTEPSDGGHQRSCLACHSLHFPRIEPAVIVLVELPGDPRKCLLGRHQGAAADRFTTLAGFVEVGESLEDAVRREVAEEAGVEVGPVSYQASQAWPFPAGIMIGFRAKAIRPEIEVDGAELMEARWFTAGELRHRIESASTPPYRQDSIGRVLIESWLAEAGEA
jgi:NAD+ diphosphatase